MSTAIPTLPPPLRDGDRLTREEFLRRWEAMPDLKQAELIDGIVYMPSPVAHTHDSFHSFVHGWLFRYAEATPGCATGLEGTWLMAEDSAPQPDLSLRIRPENGGQSRVVNDYLTGAPELVVEISHTSVAKDLGPKSDLYRRSGVREYMVVLTGKPDILWRGLVKGRYLRIATDQDGLLRSRVFPGLWLDCAALRIQDWPRVLAGLQQGLATPEHTEFVRHLAAEKR